MATLNRHFNYMRKSEVKSQYSTLTKAAAFAAEEGPLQKPLTNRVCGASALVVVRFSPSPTPPPEWSFPILIASRCRRFLREKRFREFLGIERLQIFGLLADADEFDGEAEFLLDGYDHSAFAGAVEFGDYQAC
jgi:hypothetical protein